MDGHGGWGGVGDPPAAGQSATIFRGASFCLSQAGGDITPGTPHGYFHDDARVLSRWELRVDNREPELLRRLTPSPSEERFVLRVPPPRGASDTQVLIERSRTLTDRLVERIQLRNLTDRPMACTVTLRVDADFADVFAVKEGRAEPGRRSFEVRGSSVVIHGPQPGDRVRIVLTGSDVAFGPDGLRVTVDLAAGASAVVDASVQPTRPNRDGQSQLPARMSLPTGPLVVGAPGLAATLVRSRADISSLRISDPSEPGSLAVAAGAPWFMTLFGRDSLLTAYMSLPLDIHLGLGTLRMLAGRQGRRTRPLTEEQPGRILHETRFGRDARLALGGGTAYYGSVDATPLFVMLLAELWRWGASADDVIELLPHADRALAWCRKYGDRDGDGFIEYQQATDTGLANQGWKDSWNAITHGDGTLASPPIALCEVQGYHYAALVGRAEIAESFGDSRLARRLVDRAEALREKFDRDFWLADRGFYALALDGRKRPVDALASNLGHLLWTGIVPPERAAALAEHLLSAEMFSGWGVRTLATSMGAYNPLSYHNGSVWPHDTAIAAHGLARYGLADSAGRIIAGLLEAADAVGGRLPELLAGFSRSEYAEPIPYPTACSPQAWSSAAPLLLLRAGLGFEVDLPRGRLRVAGALPDAMLPLTVKGIRVGGYTVEVAVDDQGATVAGLPRSISITSTATAATSQ